MRAADTTVDGTCGVGVLYDYNKGWGPEIGYSSESGCGWYVAGFIDNDTCKAAYEEMCEKYTLVYQSPIRRNKNSGNMFFFCIFDDGAQA